MIITKNQHDSGGIRNGYWEEYFSNGQLWFKGNYIDDKRDGYWEVYYSNGQLWFKGNYIDDKRDGYWEWYNRDGNLRESIFYHNN